MTLDSLAEKKDIIQVLDLSNSSAKNEEELKKFIQKVPEFKIKMEKVKLEDVTTHNKKFPRKIIGKKRTKKSFVFKNPIPPEVERLHLKDLCTIDIQWKMLTSLQLKHKLDEDYYTRIIEIGKLQISTKNKFQDTFAVNVKKKYNSAGILQLSLPSCVKCGEELCLSENCGNYLYTSYGRSQIFLDNEVFSQNIVQQ